MLDFRKYKKTKKVMASFPGTLLWLIIVIGIVEFLIMLMLETLMLPRLVHAIADSLILVLVISPVLYLYVAKRKWAEEALRESRSRYQDRYADALVMGNVLTVLWLAIVIGAIHFLIMLVLHEFVVSHVILAILGSLILAAVVSPVLYVYINLRKRAEEEVKESEQKFRSLAEQSPNMIFINKRGRVVYANKKCEEIMGYKREEFYSSDFDFLALIAPEYMDLVKANLSKHMRGEEVAPYECTLITKEGKRIEALETTTLMTYEGESAILGVITDITERKRMEQEIQDKNEQLEAQNEELRASNEELQATEEELRSAKEELEDRVKERTADLESANEELRGTQEQLIRSEKLAAIGQLAGGVGHELRNPLGAIRNAVYYVKGKVAKSELGQEEPRVMEFLELADDEINASNKIISDLLGFSRVGKPSVSPIRIEKVVEDALSRTPISENIELTKKLDTELPEVEADPDQIQQVLINMITNAVQAMPEGGKLTIGARERGKFLELEIADTGGGIPAEARSKIFDPLFTTRAKGIGLGLAVCKSIIDRHGGHIEVKSQVGKGTTFNIKLPLKAA